jgi:hypothetical protein
MALQIDMKDPGRPIPTLFRIFVLICDRRRDMDDNHSTRAGTDRRAGSNPTPASPPGSGASTQAATVPPVMPVLGRGMHHTLDEGACLMEYVSVLAGLRFSDRPRCTAPAVAALARYINDFVSPAGRAQLAHRAPALIGLRQARLPARRIVLAELAREGLRHDPTNLLFRTVERRCRTSAGLAGRWTRDVNLMMFTDSRLLFFTVLDIVRGRVAGADAQDERLIAILDAVITRARADELGPNTGRRHVRPALAGSAR